MHRTKRHILLFITINIFCLQKIEVNAWPGMDGWNIENMKTYNDFQYMYMPETDSITIVGYVGTEEVVVVPSEIDGKCVKEIVNFDDYANYKWYEPNEAIKEIYIPEGVTSIGGFHNCINVEKVHLSNSMQIIESEAFANCEKLKKITIKGTKVKKIGKKALKMEK